MRILCFGTGVLFALAVAGCAFETADESTATRADGLKGANEGTALSLEAWATFGDCDGVNATVFHHLKLTTTGSVDSAIMTVDGQYALTVQPQDFVHDGRIQTWEYVDMAPKAPGTYTSEICATQSGAQGRTSKHACTTLEYEARCRALEI